MGDGAGDCSAIFDDATVALMQGAGTSVPQCVWVNATRVRAQLGRETLLYPLDAIRVRANAVHPQTVGGVTLSGCVIPGGASVCADGEATVLPPAEPQVPSAALAAPVELSACDNLVLSGLGSSGGGIFPLKYLWSVRAADGFTVSEDRLAAIAAKLDEAGEPVVSAALITPGSALHFTLIVQNRLGILSTPVSVVVSKTGAVSLTTTFEGASLQRTVSRPSSTSLTGKISLPLLTCLVDQTVETGSVTFSWSIRRASAASSAVTDTSSDGEGLSILNSALIAKLGRQLIIRADTLAAGTSYFVTLTSTPVDPNSGVGASQGTVTLNVAYSPIIVVIAGGSSRTCGAALPLTLDASTGSYDPDAPTELLDRYVWSCNHPSGGAACRDAIGGTLSLTHGQAAEGILSFAGGQLDTSAEYYFSVVGTKGTRSQTSSTTVAMIAGSPPTVTILPRSSGIVNSDGSFKVNPDTRLVLGSGSATTVCPSLTPQSLDSTTCTGTFVWQEMSGAISLSDPLIRTSQTDSPFLVIAADSLLGGQQYTLRLAVNAGGAFGWAQLLVVANVPPAGGVGLVEPSQGVQFNTTFTLDQQGWFDEDLPLLYGYDFQVGAVGGSVDCRRAATGWQPLVGDLRNSKHLASTWPVGSIVVRANVDDALGARACTAVAMTVASPPAFASGDPTVASNFVSAQLDSLTEGLGQGQGGGAQAISVLAGLLLGRSETSQTNSTDCLGDDVTCEATPQSAEALRLQAQKQELTMKMLNVLSSAPPAEATTSEKMVHASALSSVVKSPSALTEASKNTALDALDGLAANMQSSDTSGGVGGTIVGALDDLLNAGVVPVVISNDTSDVGRRLATISRDEWELQDDVWLGYNPDDDGVPPTDRGATSTKWDHERMLSEVNATQASSDATNISSDVPQVVRVARRLAEVQYATMVEGELPVGGSASLFAYGVQRGVASGLFVYTPTPVLPCGINLPGEIADGLSQAMVLTMDFVKLPYKPPPRSPGKPRNTQASSAFGISLRVGEQYLPAVRLNGGEQAHIWMRRHQARWLFQCLDDTDCSGVANLDPPVAGRCISGRCSCPLPWAGHKCDRQLECWLRTSAWHGPNSRLGCHLNETLSNVDYYACSCPLHGTYDVLVIARPLNDLVAKSLMPFNVIRLPRDLKYLEWEYLMRGWIALVTLSSLTVLYMILIFIAFLCGNESELKRNARYYDFWRMRINCRTASIPIYQRGPPVSDLLPCAEQASNARRAWPRQSYMQNFHLSVG